MKTNSRIALASACGAALGYCLGTTFLSGTWLMLAALIGGILGWIAFDPRGFLKALAQAVRENATGAHSWLSELWSEPWRQILPRALKLSLLPMVLFQFLGTVLVYLATILYLPNVPVTTFIRVYERCLVVGVLFSLILFSSKIQYVTDRKKLLNRSKESALFDMTLWKFFLLTNPIILPFAIVFYAIVFSVFIGYQMVWFARWSFTLIPFIFRYSWFVIIRTCRLANNNGRLASFAGAALGGLIGVMVEHLAIGMATGAIIGVLTHYVGAFFSEGYVAAIKQKTEAALEKTIKAGTST